jgi:putative DNA methylase
MIIPISNPYEYRRRLPHFQKSGWPLFVTFCKLIREPLPPGARDLVLQHCLYDRGGTMSLHAAVVMPEHVHLLLTPLRDASGWPVPLPKIMKRIKGTSARSVNQLLGSEWPVWQEESFDHVLRSDERLEEKLEYIRQNPVRRGLVRNPGDYPWLWVESSSV